MQNYGELARLAPATKESRRADFAALWEKVRGLLLDLSTLVWACHLQIIEWLDPTRDLEARVADIELDEVTA